MSDSEKIINIFGLIGYPLSHSFSKKYFTEKFKKEGIINTVYKNFEIENISLLPQIIENNPFLKGLNVTIPYKKSIIPYLNELDENAEAIGAVNVVDLKEIDNQLSLKGYNTDYYGFLNSLKKYLGGDEKNALILGNGGAAKAVIHALKTLNIHYKIASRKTEASSDTVQYSSIDEQFISKMNIIVNTTPLGMWPNVDFAPDIPYHSISKGTIAFDLIYNPEITLFMEKAIKFGAIAVNGLEMLRLQADRAWEIFGVTP